MTFWTKNKTDIYIELYDDFASSLKTNEEISFLKKIFDKDLVNFSLPTKFDGAILSQRTLNFIADANNKKKSLKNIAKVLKKDSILVINLMPARPGDFAQIQKTLKKTETFKNSATGNMVEYWKNWIPNPMEQIWDFTNEFREGNKKASTRMKMRIIFESEMKILLELYGFKTLNIYGNWKKDKYDANSSDLIFVVKLDTNLN